LSFLAKRIIYSKYFFKNEGKFSAAAAPIILEYVKNFLKPVSVIDIGCGVGEWLKAYQNMGVKEILGIDGDYIKLDQIVIPKGNFIAKDISKPISDIDRRFDLTISLEVAEHIESSKVNIYMDNITKFSDVVLFSAAIPFQGGTHHVNEQWPSYWVELFKQKGFIPVDCLRKIIWNLKDLPIHYRQNIMFFVKEQCIDRYHILSEQVNLGVSNVLDLVHPEIYLKAGVICIMKRIVFLLSILPSAIVSAIRRRL
jgi:SAM-dependent methyltransferase